MTILESTTYVVLAIIIGNVCGRIYRKISDAIYLKNQIKKENSYENN